MTRKIIPSTFKTNILAGALILGAVGCSRGPLHQIEGNKHSVVENVDKYVKSDFNNSNINDLEMYKIDTIELNKSELENFEGFSEKLNKLAKYRNPRILVNERWEYGYAIGPRMTSSGVKNKAGFDYHKIKEYADKYIDSTVIGKVQNKVFANKNETRFFVPVEYYGKLDSTVKGMKD